MIIIIKYSSNMYFLVLLLKHKTTIQKKQALITINKDN